MDASPYQAPEAELQPAQSAPAADTPLYRISGIGLATLLAGFAAGGLLLALNGKRLGRPNAMLHYFGGALLATGAVIAAGLLLPENIPSAVFVVPQILIMVHLARSLQGPALAQHDTAGGRFESNWKAFGISILMIIALFAVILAGMLLFDPALRAEL